MMHEWVWSGQGVWAAHNLWMLLAAILVVVPVWRIFSRLGFPGWLSLLILVPLANLIVLYVVAFSDRSEPGNRNDQARDKEEFR